MGGELSEARQGQVVSSMSFTSVFHDFPKCSDSLKLSSLRFSKTYIFFFLMSFHLSHINFHDPLFRLMIMHTFCHLVHD